jgi:hypothetical protein
VAVLDVKGFVMKHTAIAHSDACVVPKSFWTSYLLNGTHDENTGKIFLMHWKQMPQLRTLLMTK